MVKIMLRVINCDYHGSKIWNIIFLEVLGKEYPTLGHKILIINIFQTVSDVLNIKNDIKANS